MWGMLTSPGTMRQIPWQSANHYLVKQIIGICSEPAMPSVVLFVDYNTHTGSQQDRHRSGKGECGGCIPSPLKRRCMSCWMDRSINLEISNARKGELTRCQCAFSKNTLRQKGTCEMKAVLLLLGRGWEPWGRRKAGLYYTDKKHQALWPMVCFTQNIWRIFIYFKILLCQRSC